MMDQRDYLDMLRRKKEDIIGESGLEKIAIEDDLEPLIRIIDVLPSAIIDMTKKRQRFLGETLYLRKTAAERLASVGDRLYPYRLKIFDAFRPIELQQTWFDEVYERIGKDNPSWSQKRVREEAFIFVFPPSWDLKTPPPHCTGGAIDLTIIDNYGRELDMGTKYADFSDQKIYTNSDGLTVMQSQNRTMLIRTMANAGFMSYPGEWWHFSMFDREWAAYLGKAKAYYTRAEDPYKYEMQNIYKRI